jgi:hypothetical protein
VPKSNQNNAENIEKKEESSAEILKKEDKSVEISDESNTPAMKIKNIWAKICFIETVYELYIEASLIPESERDTSIQFSKCIDAIYGLIDQRSGEYDLILRKMRKIDI